MKKKKNIYNMKKTKKKKDTEKKECKTAVFYRQGVSILILLLSLFLSFFDTPCLGGDGRRLAGIGSVD